MTRALSFITAIAITLLGSTGGARAYSDASQFALPAEQAGGGGRFYTGSPAEGYACDTCHTGGPEPQLEVTGLPERYVPNATYLLAVRWPASLEHVGAALELTDDRGRGAGTIALPGDGDRRRSELCEPADVGVLAAQLYAAGDGRSIVAVSDCGARELRLQWTAPRTAVGPVWLAGAVIASDHAGDMTGDGVAAFAYTVPAFGDAPPEYLTGGSCAIGGAGRARAPGCGLACLALWLVWRRVLPQPSAAGVRRRAWVLLLAVAATLGISCITEEAPRSAVRLERGRAVRPWDEAIVLDAKDAAVESAIDANDPGDGAAADGGEPSPTPTRLVIRVTTLSQGGRYQPKNVGAIWVEDAAGNWVKTLKVWASLRERYLSEYYASNPTRNKLDAVTSATVRMHGSHDVSWDLTDATGAAVPDGSYVVFVEVTDRDARGQFTSIEFTKSNAPIVVKAGDTPYFSGLELRFE